MSFSSLLFSSEMVPEVEEIIMDFPLADKPCS